MLIRFSVENFRSFNEEAVFSMIPGRMQKHSDHVLNFQESNLEALRIALLYGANASGKSNLVRAMNFAQKFIVKGRRPKQNIQFEPFKLNKNNATKPSRFEFEFVTKGQTYAYGFSADNKRVQEEWLYSINSKDEHPLFERKTNAKNEITSSFYNVSNDDDSQFLNFVTRGTRPNQLLLTALAEDNVKDFEPIYDWFRNNLIIIFPDSRARGIQLEVHKDQNFRKDLANFLHSMNTGIDEVCTNAIDPDSLDIPLDLIFDEIDTIEDDEADNSIDTMTVLDGPQGRYLIHRNQEGSVEAHSLGTRRYVDGKPIDFDVFEESDGTQRLIDLFPVLYGTKDKVFIIDELERSLHPNLMRNFIEMFLKSENTGQLIVTTHGATLLDLALLRRDEIWFVEKSKSGSSVVYSLEEFKPRHDLDIRKGYLQGRFGAIPVFGSSLSFARVKA